MSDWDDAICHTVIQIDPSSLAAGAAREILKLRDKVREQSALISALRDAVAGYERRDKEQSNIYYKVLELCDIDPSDLG